MYLIIQSILYRKIIFIFMIIGLTISSPVLAKKQQHHLGHKAHVHGSATLNVAFDGLIGKIEFKSPTEAILGFEHEAKTASELEIKKNISKYVQYEAQLGCTILKERIITEHDSKNFSSSKTHAKAEHSDFIAIFNVNCKKTIKGTKIKFNFKELNKLNEIDTTVLVDDLQKSIEIKKSEIILELL